MSFTRVPESSLPATRVTRLLGIEHPLVGGAMMWLSGPELTAAVSNAGGLGVMASAMYQTQEDFGRALDSLLSLTDKPFAVNLNLFPARRGLAPLSYLEVMAAKGVRVAETSGHRAPEDLCRHFRRAGMIWMHKCVGPRYARKAQSLGADIVTVVGYENGGATGRLDLGTLVLVPLVADALDIPVIGGGGVADGRGVAALLALGAEAVILGTRLLLTRECPLHPQVKHALLNATELDTRLVMRSLNNTHRVYNNRAARKCLELEARGAGLSEVVSQVAGERASQMYREGDPDYGIISCGQAVGLIDDLPSVAELFSRLASRAGRALRRAGGI